MKKLASAWQLPAISILETTKLMRIEFENPTNGRWYTISITADLFGSVILTRMRGGAGRSGISVGEYHPSLMAALAEARAIKRTRLKNGYLVTFSEIELDKAA